MLETAPRLRDDDKNFVTFLKEIHKVEELRCVTIVA